MLMIVAGYLAWLVFCLHSLRLFCGALLRGARHTLAFLRLTPRSLTLARRSQQVTSEGNPTSARRSPQVTFEGNPTSRRRSPQRRRVSPSSPRTTRTGAMGLGGPSRLPRDEGLPSTSSAPPRSTTNLERAMERAREQRLWNRRTGTPPSGATSSNLTGTPPSSRPGGGIENLLAARTRPSKGNKMDQGSRLPLSTPSSPSATRRSTPQCKEKAKDAGDIILRGLSRGED